nr:uncharacterized protein LOC109776804 isoform X2 [Aegilops tauschii subsp. strangulata]XP_020191058.1 uncharacterized protein LOC109776804 isoform X2 [Aegilops tauschii subsp. strangulata]
MKTSTQQSETSTTKDNILEVKIKESRLEAAVEGGEAEMQSVPGNGHTKELEKEALMEQTMQNSNVATQQPEMNMLDADTNFPKCNASDCSTQKEAPEKSTSLNYMLLSARLARALETTEQDMNSKDEANTHVPPTFSGFQHNTVNSNQSEHCTESKTMYQANEAAAIECVELDTTASPQDNNNQDDFRFNEVREQGKHAGLDIDINIPLSNSGIDDKQKHVEDFQHTMHPLDIARQKYFFFDDMTPTCRIFVDHDDCGNEITEPELWRDLDTDSNAYEAQIEEAKKKYKSNTSKDIIKGFSSQHEQTALGDSSIHYAQKEPATTEMCKYRNFLPGFEEIDDIIDLTWDNAKTCYYPMRTQNYENDVSSSQKNKKLLNTSLSTFCPNLQSYLTTPFIGKRLFTDEVIEEDDQDGTKDQPIPVIDELQLSPDVQILGERVFNGSCSNMVNTADNLYNSNLTLGSYSSGKENLPPKRLVRPSKYQCSPFDNDLRGPLTPSEKQLHSNIVALGKIEPDRRAVLVDKTSLSLGQLGNSFDTNGHVEAYVFNVFYRLLFRDNHPRQSKKHYFFTTIADYFLQAWTTEEGRISMRRRALISFSGAGTTLPLHESERLFFPSVHHEHWILFIVDIVARKFIFLDSVYDGESPFHMEVKDLMINNFLKTWEESRLRRMGFRNFGIEYPNMPKQIGRDACGIFVLKWMQTFASRNPLQPQFRMKDVADARVRLAVDILFSNPNTDDDAKRLVKYFRQ